MGDERQDEREEERESGPQGALNGGSDTPPKRKGDGEESMRGVGLNTSSVYSDELCSKERSEVEMLSHLGKDKHTEISIYTQKNNQIMLFKIKLLWKIFFVQRKHMENVWCVVS